MLLHAVHLLLQGTLACRQRQGRAPAGRAADAHAAAVAAHAGR